MKQVKTIKQAILALPELSKGWKLGGTLGRESYCYFKRKNILTISTVYNSIETYHAAAKTLGMEIGWLPDHHAKYIGYFAHTAWAYNKDHWHIISNLGQLLFFKTPAKAIDAAFIAAVNYAISERGK